MKRRASAWRIAAVVVCTAAAGLIVLSLARARGWFEPEVAGGPPTLRLISAEQYLTAIQDLFGEDIEVSESFPPVQRRQGLLALGAASAVVTPGALEQFERAGHRVAAQVVDEEHRSALISCRPESSKASAACAEEFFARVGRRLYRRPLDANELQLLVGTASEAAAQSGDFYAGIGYALAGMLASPKFLYFTELTEPDPDRPGRVRLDAYAKASRLSLLLWNAPPDESLLAAAETGELHDDEALARQVERLVGSPRLEQGLRAFFSDLLAFNKFDTLAKDSVIYPFFTRNVANAAKEQALRLIGDHLLTRSGDYRDLFTTPRTFVNATLGPLYKVSVGDPQNWFASESQPEHRAGLLTSLSFLALHSHPGRSSPTQRGRAIREILLCQRVPDPPPNVSLSLEDPSGELKTVRERLMAHSTDPACAGCHKITDPMGLALENFDGAGAFRTVENGAAIDTSGELDGNKFSDVVSLGQAMREHPALTSCLANRLYAYAIGRETGVADRPWLAYLGKRFAVSDYRVPDLMREIASSNAFYAVSPEQPT